MSLHCFGMGIPDSLEFPKLPSLTSLIVDEIGNTQRPFAILTVHNTKSRSEALLKQSWIITSNHRTIGPIRWRE